MNVKKIVLAISLALGCVSFSQAATVPAAEQGHGSVTFTGSIIDAPCSIDSESIDQTVDLGQVSNVTLDNKGKSKEKTFDIKLEKCNVGDKGKSVTAKFTGAEGGTAGLLGITGTAKGASIAVMDGKGTLIGLGKSTTAQQLQNGINTLQFSAHLQGDGASGGVVPGNFTSVANFTLDYQ
ncbi:type 1 fimbrial protein [Serratia sp. JSRIV001]|uniref:fimbrial protein n=1 Tax=Serratia sp. JSRIV001 TaxID=2831893 RepID=UPI001CC19EEA|nr:fimbrial protein [Serratia sp. JSRIV001]UAN48729.1 type 1 fimbrial protein [Serratia sp. JSRIV001]